MNDKNYFEENAISYAKHRPSYPPELVESLASLCKSHEHAVDVGCGTGQLSVKLSNYFNLVTATDSSSEQLDNASQNSRVNCIHESADALSAVSNSVGLVVAAQSAHWFNLSTFYQRAGEAGKEESVIAMFPMACQSLTEP